MQADAERFLTHVSARRAAAAAPLQAGNFGEPSNCIHCALLASLKAKATNLGSLEPAALAGFILQASLILSSCNCLNETRLLGD